MRHYRKERSASMEPRLPSISHTPSYSSTASYSTYLYKKYGITNAAALADVDAHLSKVRGSFAEASQSQAAILTRKDERLRRLTKSVTTHY
jgi:hypothetical protein